MTKAERIEHAARALVDAMDRQYGNQPFSQNVCDQRDLLRELIASPLDPRDKAYAPREPL